MVGKMKLKKSGQVVDVASIISMPNGKLYGIVFNEEVYRTGGAGWQKIAMRNLLPLDVEEVTTDQIEENKSSVKERIYYSPNKGMHVCSDNSAFSNKKEAIDHEMKLLREEEE